jgi:sugar transferase (PEP-CTERM/EpsH1 system associated)
MVPVVGEMKLMLSCSLASRGVEKEVRRKSLTAAQRVVSTVGAGRAFRTMQIETRTDECFQARDDCPTAEPAQGVSPLRVLHVITHLLPGGTEYVLLKLMSSLGHELFEHGICASRYIDPTFAALHHVEDKLFVAGSPDLRFQFPLFRFAKIMRSFKPHVVHTRNWGALEGVLAARLAGVPVVIHSEHGYEMDSLEGLPLRRRLFRRAAYAMADQVFTNSRNLRDYHARQAWISPEQIRVIHNGVDTGRFEPQPDTRVRMRRELGLSADCFVVGSIGRLVPIKDHCTLLKAAAALAGRGVNVRLLLVGTGPQLGALQREADALAILSGRVSFFGASDRIPELLNALDAFVLPSLGEGMSNTLLEAMACGLPVVATRVGGNPELIEEGSSGWLFSPRDVSGLADMLHRLSCDSALCRQLGANARQRAVNQFSFQQMVSSYRNLYLEHARQRLIAGGLIR